MDRPETVDESKCYKIVSEDIAWFMTIDPNDSGEFLDSIIHIVIIGICKSQSKVSASKIK